MARMVNCVKLKKEAEGLDYPPFPGALGARVQVPENFVPPKP